ncbi:hypothetical protein J6590_011706 [Homalodisca vitripennis]|nr:hypothetical protein J6590_011706 [Homalodisca vitripennis]
MPMASGRPLGVAARRWRVQGPGVLPPRMRRPCPQYGRHSLTFLTDKTAISGLSVVAVIPFRIHRDVLIEPVPQTKIPLKVFREKLRLVGSSDRDKPPPYPALFSPGIVFLLMRVGPSRATGTK